MGWTNADNKFGPCDIVCGQTLGAGVNYTSIQQAIDDQFAIGPGNVLIRPFTYTEDLTFRSGVNLIGVSANASGGDVRIIGSHTFPDGTASCKNIYFSSPGDAFVVGNPAGAGVVDFTLKECQVIASNYSFDLNALTGGASITAEDCNFISDNYTIQCTLNANFNLRRTKMLSNGAGTIFVNPGVTSCGGFLEYCNLVSVASPCIDYQDVATVNAQYTYFEAPNQPISFNAVGTFNAYQNTYKNGSASSEYIVGPGNYTYGGEVIDPIQSSGIDNAATQVKLGWRPWAETGTGVPTDVRGTACFDASQFTVIDGYVHSTTSGAFPWVERSVSAIVNPNEGNFTVAVITLTLPAQPQPIGTTCKFKVVTNDQLIIAGNPGDVLQLGNQSGTTITNTLSGDAIEMTHYDLGIWLVNASIGNWDVT